MLIILIRDGVTQYPEECDDGEDLNGGPYSHCRKNCTLIEPCGNPHTPHCGDGVVQYPELCDLGCWNGQPGSKVSISLARCSYLLAQMMALTFATVHKRLQAL